MKRVSRRKLRNLCIDGLDIKWGKTLTGIKYSDDGEKVTAHFADGTEYRGDLIVGADGPRSKVRELLLGTERARSQALGVVQNTTLVKYGTAEKALHVRSGNPLFYLGYNPDGIVNFVSGMPLLSPISSRRKQWKLTRSLRRTVQDIPDPSRPEDWTFIVGTSWLGQRDPNMDNAGRLADLRKAVSKDTEYLLPVLAVLTPLVIPGPNIRRTIPLC